ncbi:probable ATP-dependent RNA helicase spindle-E [Drosophila kikkawai]|uniref:Probable ATP-dependent RNA helicase spindle-E n=1 Tax=Drosophila kikkawai TaxID=30033 RepID=A0A6P4J7Z0_DROKI|nr:probable ATP-dependent RNA helicase spindle-E [Drosophila kikkawai]
MDEEVMDFFDFSKECKREVAPPSGCISSDVNSMTTETNESKPPKREVFGVEYAGEIVAKEKQRLDGLLGNERSRNRTLDDIDTDDDDDEDIKIRTDEEYYKKYRFNLNRDKNLPIYAKREEIITAINANPVVILKGETGCGKTTQVPQYILDEGFRTGQYCNIVVTQPRRIAAISIANRVCEERQWQPRTVCSYQVGLHRETGEDTRLLYCTTGVLLNILIHNKTLTHYTHIVLDEVHERDQDMDFLLIVVRRLLATNSRHVKVILMSATIDPRGFADYFATRNSMPPVISTSHGRKHSIEKFYRDQLTSIKWKDDVEEQYEPRILEDGYKAAVKIILVIDNMERQAERHSGVSYHEAMRQGAVLIFLPGIYEIDCMADSITHLVMQDNSMKINIVRCYSLMSTEDQRGVFESSPSGYRKVILTTNIAESSITVPDVSYVIDFCLTKVLVTDTATNFSSLRLTWASRANCRQRAGRVGRLRSGRVYRMVTKAFYQQQMLEFGIPEMLRQPLQNSVLKAKELGMGSPVEILALALSPPNLSDIQNTILLLKEVGALFPTVDGIYNEMDGDITFWGTIMSRLPVDTRLSRLIILGFAFNLLDEAIIIAAGLSLRALYTDPGRSRQFEAFWMHYIFSDDSGSDLVGIWRIYNTYLNMCENSLQQDSAGTWAKRFHVSLRSLKEMHLLVQELRSRCYKLGLHPIPSEANHNISDMEKMIILQVIIAGAFYPNYFIRSKNATVEPDRDMYQIISGLDPCRTVYFTNFKPGYMGELYTRRIKELFQEAKIPPENMDVTFQHGSQKVFVTFKQDDCSDNTSKLVRVPGRVKTEVYKAVRMRLNKLCRPLRIMEHNIAMNYVQQRKIGDVIEGRWIPPSKAVNVELLALPSVYDKKVTGQITHIYNCGKFYFQPLSLGECIRNMTEIFNSPQQLSIHVANAGAITKGLMVLAKRCSHFQRALVIRPENQTNRQPKFYVRFIDYGDVVLLPMEMLRLMPDELQRQYGDLPPRMFECRLALVQPSSVISSSNQWSQKANEMLESLGKCGRFEVEVYSLVDDVAAVIIHMRDGILNEKIVELKLARRADEDYMSRMDHDFRTRKQETVRHLTSAERQQLNEEYLRSCQMPKDLDLPPPPLDRCHSVALLKGPYSPLETSMQSTIRVGMWKTVKIDRNSVNAVLLHDNPQDQHDQLIVSHATVESTDGQILTARGTTLMPNVHGFGALMVMLFCPTMQIKCNRYGTKYVSILAGLGYNPETMEPYFEEHDTVINLDVKILEDDVRLINQMRYNIDSVFFNFEGEEFPTLGVHDRAKVCNQLRSLVFRLISKDRSYIEVHSSNADYLWEKLEDLEPQAEPFGKRSIFPMHAIPELQEEPTDSVTMLVSNCEELHNWRTYQGVLKPVTCKLCNQQLESVPQLRMHLLTQLHRDRERQIGYRDEDR